MKKIIKNIGKRILLLLYRVERLVFPINKNIIIFESNVGRNYTGNPKAVYEEMVKRELDKKYHCVYILEDTNVHLPGNAELVKRLRFRYFYYMAVAGIWVSDSRFPEFIQKRNGVKYIQTWHGTPLKKLALDMDCVHMDGETSLADYKDKFRKNSQTWDFLISQNRFSTEVFQRCFDFQKEMLETGYPRNDVLFHNNTESYVTGLKERYGIRSDAKIVLYAPTWRDNEFYGNNRYKFNQALDYDLLERELSDEYVFLVKCHYLVQDTIDWSKYKGFVYAFDSHTDIADLYLIADYLITDYSSVMFDYSILKRPMFFFAYDLTQYEEELRGFYFDYMKEIPGPVSQTTEELVAAIKNYRPEEWVNKYQAFSEKFNTFDHGDAAKSVVALIESL